MNKHKNKRLKRKVLKPSVEFGSRFIAMPDGKQIKLQIWDTVSVYLFLILVYLFTTTTKRLGKRVFEVSLKVIIEELLELYWVD